MKRIRSSAEPERLGIDGHGRRRRIGQRRHEWTEPPDERPLGLGILREHGQDAVHRGDRGSGPEGRPRAGDFLERAHHHLVEQDGPRRVLGDPLGPGETVAVPPLEVDEIEVEPHAADPDNRQPAQHAAHRQDDRGMPVPPGQGIGPRGCDGPPGGAGTPPARLEDQQRGQHREGRPGREKDPARADQPELHQPLEASQHQHREGERRGAGGGHDPHAGPGERPAQRVRQRPAGGALLLVPRQEVDRVVAQPDEHRHEHDRQDVEVPHGERRDPERPRTPHEKRGRRERRPDEAAEERH